jgi:hypothetical protein
MLIKNLRAKSKYTSGPGQRATGPKRVTGLAA